MTSVNQEFGPETELVLTEATHADFNALQLVDAAGSPISLQSGALEFHLAENTGAAPSLSLTSAAGRILISATEGEEHFAIFSIAAAEISQLRQERRGRWEFVRKAVAGTVDLRVSGPLRILPSVG